MAGVFLLYKSTRVSFSPSFHIKAHLVLCRFLQGEKLEGWERAHLGVTNHAEDLYITLSIPDTSPFKWERNGRHKSQPEAARSIRCPADWCVICHKRWVCFPVPPKHVAISNIYSKFICTDDIILDFVIQCLYIMTRKCWNIEGEKTKQKALKSKQAKARRQEGSSVSIGKKMIIRIVKIISI